MKYKYFFPYKDLSIWKSTFDRYLNNVQGKFRMSIPRFGLKSKVLKSYDMEIFYDFLEQITVELKPIDRICVEFQMNPLTLFTNLLPLIDWEKYENALHLTHDDIVFIRELNSLVSKRMNNPNDLSHLKHAFLFEELEYDRFPAVLRALDYCWEITNLYWYPSAKSAFIVIRNGEISKAFVLSKKGIEDIGPLFLHFDFEKGFYILDKTIRKYLDKDTLFMKDFLNWKNNNKNGLILINHYN